MSRFYLTTPIYYLNGEPHFGHAYTTIATDIIARYHRQKGDDVFFLTGTDEHGNKVAQAAAERGLSPREHVDELSQKFRDMTATVGATADFFMRTTDAGHERFVQDFVQRLYDNGDIEKRSYGGLYCTHCEGFWKEDDLVEGNCPDHGVPPDWLEEENYYFMLSNYQDRLSEFLRANPDWARPKMRHNEALSFVERGLDDISISRETLTWGVPVPWDSRQVIYVWVDALINYLSALTYARPGEDLIGRYWPAQVHLMSKDILKFHAVIWPALLMSAGYELPEGEFIHGYLLMGGEKMSKTRGNVLDPFAVIEEHGVDPLRFYLIREVNFGADGAISLEGFEQRYNNELANELGNLVSRSVSMIGKYRDGVVPAADPGAAALAELRDQGEAMVAHSGERFDALELTAALEAIWEYVRRLNRYVEEEAPWKLARDEALAGHLDEALLGLVAGQRLVALCLYPVIPGTAVEILRRLGQPCGESDLLLGKAVWGGVTGGVAAEQAPPLFPRIEATKE